MRKVRREERKVIVRRLVWTVLPILMLVGVVLSIIFR